jgi:hypothetical protein
MVPFCCNRPWQRLYFSPEPQGQGAFRPTHPGTGSACPATAARVATDAMSAGSTEVSNSSGGKAEVISLTFRTVSVTREMTLPMASAFLCHLEGVGAVSV